jgi:lysylphosphatidylglycerol synthetase-like protein (DUF2156 family)
MKVPSESILALYNQEAEDLRCNEPDSGKRRIINGPGITSPMARRRKSRFNIKPIFSAFVWGLLTSLGIDPGQMLVETTMERLGPYFQIAAVALFLVVIYFSYNWVIEGISRSRKAWRVAGAIGIAAIVLAFLSGFFVLTWDKAAIMLVISVIAWAYATV